MPHGIATAFDRLDDFLAVQGGSPSMDAVLNLQAAVGIDDDARRVIRERLEALADRPGARRAANRPGEVLLGILLGLFAASR